jgi:choline dehydrogenase
MAESPTQGLRSNPVFDYVIVGAGSAGCALAARLTESGKYKVCLLEAGEDDRWIWISIPTGVAKIVVGERALWRYTTQPNAGLNGRPLFWPRGKLLGGTASINGMFWVHGNPLEYNRWRDELGLEGWGYDEVLPYFKRMEAYAKGDPAARGHDGPLVITEHSPRDKLTDTFLKACAQAGIEETPDYNAGAYLGGGLMQFSTRKGLRWAVREGYLRPAMQRGNLTVLPRTQASRIVLEGEGENVRAVAVEYQRQGERPMRIGASREIVICAGTIQTPPLLEASGIGNRALLESLGIPVRKHLPGVGENLRDHLHARLMVEVQGMDTLNNILRNPWLKTKMALRWMLKRDGLMSVPGATAHAYCRTEKHYTSPDIKLQLHHLTSPDERNPKKLVLDERPGFSLGVVHQQPASRGSIHLASPDPYSAPTITANYLSEEEDVQAFLRGLRLARRVTQQPAFKPYYVKELRPGPLMESDSELTGYIRSTIFSSYHPVGTARMGADAMAVVDAQLRVHGVAGLRVADASVLPTIPASNTNAAAILAGEKAADFMLEEAKRG